MQAPVVAILGHSSQAGTYLLRIRLARPLQLRFGRFAGGQPVPLAAGDYLYVGSALGQQGAMSLAPRLLRHATRSAGRPPHAIRDHLLASLREAGLGGRSLSPPHGKRLFWNVDYLLDVEEAEITQVYALRSPTRRESEIAHRLQDDPHTLLPARGLGAHDHPGSTHLLQVEADGEWWQRLSTTLNHLLESRAAD